MFKFPTLAATFCIIVATSSFAHANDYQQMMQGMMQMQSCLATNVDESKLEAMGKNSEKMVNEIKRLCAAGKRQEAQDSAINYSKKMLKDPNFQGMQKCIAQIGDILPNMPGLQEGFDLDALNNKHICDEL